MSPLLSLCLAPLLVTSYMLAAVSADVELSHVSTIYLPYNVSASSQPQYALLSNSVEQLAYHIEDKLIYVVGEGIMHVINASDPNNLTREVTVLTPGHDFTDIEVCGDHVFISVDNEVNKTQGQLRVYRKFMRDSNSSLELIHTVIVGSLPDMLHPRPDCRTVLVALEAEAYVAEDGSLQDPEGAVVIVHFQDGVEGDKVSVKTLDFTAFNDRYEDLLPTGVRFVYRDNNNTFSADVEPEYIAIDEQSNKAFVCLQENNGVAEVDLVTETISKIHGLGYKQWGTLDRSDKDNGIEIAFSPIRALYLPDTIKFHQWGSRRLVFTANEGDAKEYESVGFDETIRGYNFQDSEIGAEIPLMVRSALKYDTQLGRLKFSNLDGCDENRTFHNLYTYGGRSFSIWDAEDNFRRVYDSGEQIEKYTALYCPHLFNTNNGDTLDERSDDKGPESESLSVGEIGDRLYIFVGNERPGTITVFSLGKDDTSMPRFEQMFCGGIPDDSRSIEEKFEAREVFGIDPEDIKFFSASEGPADYPVLIVAGAVSGTVSILKVNVTGEMTSGGDEVKVTPSPTVTDDENGCRFNAVSPALLLLTVFLRQLVC